MIRFQCFCLSLFFYFSNFLVSFFFFFYFVQVSSVRGVCKYKSALKVTGGGRGRGKFFLLAIN